VGPVAVADGDMLVSVRATGQVFAVRKGTLDPVPLTGPAEMLLSRPTGMLDMAMHPKFAENRLIYFTYHKPLEGNTWRGRSRWAWPLRRRRAVEPYRSCTRQSGADVGFAPGFRPRRG